MVFFAVDLLQAADGDVFLALLGCDRFDQSLGSCDRGDARNVELQRRFAYRFFVVVRSLAERCVDNERDIALADEVGDVRTTLIYLENRLTLEPDLMQTLRRAVGRDKSEAKFVKPASEDHRLPLV